MKILLRKMGISIFSSPSKWKFMEILNILRLSFCNFLVLSFTFSVSLHYYFQYMFLIAELQKKSHDNCKTYNFTYIDFCTKKKLKFTSSTIIFHIPYIRFTICSVLLFFRFSLCYASTASGKRNKNWIYIHANA